MTGRAIVVGAGALGCACAFELSRRRWRVTLVDAAGPPSASALAAGMLAPAFESVLDAAEADRATLLTDARDQWPAFAEAAGVMLHREGARWIGPDAEGVAARLETFGFEARLERTGVFTPDDWRLEPQGALRALAAPLERRLSRVGAVRPGRVETDAGPIEAELVVLAGGVGSVEGAEVAPALSAVTPIRGQIVRMVGPPPPCVLRMPGAYVAPSPGGALVGASMEVGRRSLAPDAQVTRELLAAAAAWPGLSAMTADGAVVGLRGASPDGLPLAGLVAPGLAVALAPRRNGWLLAPLIARIVSAAAAGEAPGRYAAAFHPHRFRPM